MLKSSDMLFEFTPHIEELIFHTDITGLSKLNVVISQCDFVVKVFENKKYYISKLYETVL